MLRTIRNKHSYHPADDSEYDWNSLKEGTAVGDWRIGSGTSERKDGYIYSVDVNILFDYLKQKVLSSSLQIRSDVSKVAFDYTGKLMILAEHILEEMLLPHAVIRERPQTGEE